MKIVIPMKLPSLNDYIRICRGNRYAAARTKKDIENEIGQYIEKLPRYEKPVRIDFHWIEKTKRRDCDNIAFAKKFILDALVKFGKLKDDNRKCVVAFSDRFSYGDENRVEIEIMEVDDVWKNN